MAKYVRVLARPTEEKGNEDATPLYFDVVLDSDDKIHNDRPIFGFQGDIGSRRGSSYPFVLYSDGRSDYGQEYDDNRRFGEIDLRDGRVVLNRRFRSHGILGSSFDEHYYIAQIIVLAEN